MDGRDTGKGKWKAGYIISHRRWTVLGGTLTRMFVYAPRKVAAAASDGDCEECSGLG